MIHKLTIIGVGLIGGSLARALRAAGQVREVVGYDCDLANLEEAVTLGVVDRIETSLADGVCDADMVVLAVPVGSCGEILAQLAPYLAADAVVTDVGSVKGSVVTVARATLGARFPAFVPGHPIAGSERSGVAASLTELFRKRRVVLTPCVETDTCAVERVAQMWLAAGAEIVTMSVSHHDEILAATSHLPHLLAYTLVDMLARAENSRDLFSSAAGGFRDFTRVASSDPAMWRDICLSNRAAIIQVVEAYRQELSTLLTAIERGDGEALQKTFVRAKQARDACQ